MSSKSVIKYFAKPACVLMVILILLLGLFVIQMVALGMEMMLTIQKTHKWTFEPSREHKEPILQEKIDRSEKILLSDGTIFLKFTEYSSAKRQSVIQIYDVNNNLIWDGFSAFDANTNKEVYKDANGAPMPFEDYLRWYRISEDISYPFTDLHWKIKADFSDTLDFVTDSSKDAWRYDFAKGYFTGYSSNREIIGYIGLNGFVKDRENVKSFGRLLRWEYQRQYDYEIYRTLPVIWITDKCSCFLDMQNRKVDMLFNTEGNNLIVGFSSYDSYPARTSTIKYQPFMDFVTEDNVHHLIFHEPEQKLNVSLPENCIGKIEDLALTTIENDIFFKITVTDTPLTAAQKRHLWENREYFSKEHKKSVGFYKVNQTGSLELVNHYDWVEPIVKNENRDDEIIIRQRSKPYVTAFSPPIYDWLLRASGDYITNFSYSDSALLSSIFGIIRESRPLNAPLNLLISLIIMAFTFWHGLARRNSLAALIFWVILAGLFNLAGLLAYLMLNHTPVIRCPVCDKNRGLQSITCIRCGNPLPVPQRKPTDLILTN
jgi:hypothetical protein